MDRELEKQRVREWNRQLLYAILGKQQLLTEPQKPYYNLKSQVLLSATMNAVRELFPVAYKDRTPGITQQESWRIQIQKTSLLRYQEAIEEQNFIAARKILYSVLEHCHTEQQYDLSYLLRYDLGDLKQDTLYTIGQAR